MMTEIKRFNVRVYGIMLNNSKEILLSTEQREGFRFTKFPGGGLELGEGIRDCLKREFREELGIEVELKAHFYTTDFFQQSAFRKEEQIISIYYLVESDRVDRVKSGMKALDSNENNSHYFHWRKLSQIEKQDLTFPIDQMVLEMLKGRVSC